MLVEQGGKVVLVDINVEVGVVKVVEFGVQVCFVRVDIVSEVDGCQVVVVVLEVFGGFYGLVNCVGVVLVEKVFGCNGIYVLESFCWVIDINLVGSFNMLCLVVEVMFQGQLDEGGECGVIVNIVLVVVFDGQIGQVVYFVLKSGVVGMILFIVCELVCFGIWVMIIVLGIFEILMMVGMFQEVCDFFGVSVLFLLCLGCLDEYVVLVWQIIENSMFNGEVICFDGVICMVVC